MDNQPARYPRKIYHSKRDTWLVILLWAIILFSAASAIYITFVQESIISLLVQEALFLAIVAFCLSLLRSTYYTLDGDALHVRTGPLRWSIPLAEIEEVKPVRNLLSSAALSIDRLYIRQRNSKTGTYISPEDQAGFLMDLVSRSVGLELVNGRVVRINNPR